MLARYSGFDQMHIGEQQQHQLLQNSGSNDGSGANSGLLMTVGGQLSSSGLGITPMINPLNSYSTTGVPVTTGINNPLLNVSGNDKLGYSSTTGINYNGLLKNYQTSGTLHEVFFSFFFFFKF